MLLELLKNVPRLMSDEPRAILKSFVVLKAIYDLKLVPKNVFLVRLLPKVRGNLLILGGECIRHVD